MKKILLLTGTINPKKFKTPFTKLIDERERLNQYLDAIKKYILLSNFNILIFCENSNYNYNYKKLKELAKKNKKTLEIIKFVGNKDEMFNRGKGYGEAEIIEKAIKKSKYLASPKQTFYKVTGRIFIKNINKILENSKKDNYFFSVGKKHCVTLFFKCSVEFYKKNLFGAGKECNERKSIHLENVFYDKLIMHKKILSCFVEYPLYEGSSGTNNEIYKNGLKWFIRNLQLKMGFLNIR